jgi:hypothetical protein
MGIKKSIIGEIVSIIGFLLGVYLLFEEFAVPKITGYATSIVTVNATNAFISATITIISVACFLFFRANK